MTNSTSCECMTKYLDLNTEKNNTRDRNIGLVHQFRQRNIDSFTTLVEIYQTPIYNLCYWMLGISKDAEEAAQETFFKAFEQHNCCDREYPDATSLLSIAARLCIAKLCQRQLTSLFIKNGNKNIYDFELNTKSSNIENDNIQTSETLLSALDKLDPVDRAIIVIYYWNHASEIEIAQILQISVSAVKQRLHRSRRTLAQFWEKEPSGMCNESKPDEHPAFLDLVKS